MQRQAYKNFKRGMKVSRIYFIITIFKLPYFSHSFKNVEKKIRLSCARRHNIDIPKNEGISPNLNRESGIIVKYQSN